MVLTQKLAQTPSFLWSSAQPLYDGQNCFRKNISCDVQLATAMLVTFDNVDVGGCIQLMTISFAEVLSKVSHLVPMVFEIKLFNELIRF